MTDDPRAEVRAQHLLSAFERMILRTRQKLTDTGLSRASADSRLAAKLCGAGMLLLMSGPPRSDEEVLSLLTIKLAQMRAQLTAAKEAAGIHAPRIVLPPGGRH